MAEASAHRSSSVKKAEQWWLALLRAGRGFLGHIPLTLGIIAVVVAVNIATRSLQDPAHIRLNLLARVKLSSTNPLLSSYTSLFYPEDLTDLLVMILVILVFVGTAERVMGKVRTVATLLLVPPMAAGIFLWLGDTAAPYKNAYLSVVDLSSSDGLVGFYPAAAAAIFAASSFMTSFWRRRTRVLLFSFLLMLVLYLGSPRGAYTLLAGLLGFFLGVIFVWRSSSHKTPRHVLQRSTIRETRFMVAVIVAMFALGSIVVTFLAYADTGVLSTLGYLLSGFTDGPVHSEGICGGNQSCQVWENIFAPGGPVSHLVALFPAVVLVIAAFGLRKGRFIAWVVSLSILLLVQFSALFIVIVYRGIFWDENMDEIPNSPEMTLRVALLIITPLILLGILGVTAKRFTVRSADPRASRRLFSIVVITALGIAAIFTAVWLLEGEQNQGTSLLACLLLLFLPAMGGILPPQSLDVNGPVTNIILGSGGLIFWVTACAAFVVTLRARTTSKATQGDDVHHARKLLHRNGGSLGWMALWEGNHYWFTENQKAGIAYQVHTGVAVTVADPFGDPEYYPELFEAFQEFCHQQALTPCFYSVNEHSAQALELTGMLKLQVAQETVLHIQGLEFTGKAWQNMRTAVSKASKLGVKPWWSTYRELPPEIQVKLGELSAEWTMDRGLPEMKFTLGGLDELEDDEVLVCLAIDQQGVIHGVTSWLPSYQNGVLSSWTLDFMRRSNNGFNGVMEFLVTTGITHLREPHEYGPAVDRISLSGSPLVIDAEDTQAAMLTSFLQWIARRLEPVYGFASLASFKRRFKPEEHPLYLMYADELTLASISRAVVSAYLPGLSVRQSARLLSKIRNDGE